MKKHTLALSGLIIEGVALGFMFYGIQNDKKIVWIALPLVFIGLAMTIFGVIRNSKKTA